MFLHHCLCTIAATFLKLFRVLYAEFQPLYAILDLRNLVPMIQRLIFFMQSLQFPNYCELAHPSERQIFSPMLILHWFQMRRNFISFPVSLEHDYIFVPLLRKLFFLKTMLSDKFWASFFSKECFR